MQRHVALNKRTKAELLDVVAVTRVVQGSGLVEVKLIFIFIFIFICSGEMQIQHAQMNWYRTSIKLMKSRPIDKMNWLVQKCK